MGEYKQWRHYVNKATSRELVQKLMTMADQFHEMTDRRNYWWERAKYAERRLKELDPDFVPYGEKPVEKEA